MQDSYKVVLAPNPSILTGQGTNTIVIGYGEEGATVIDPAVDDRAYIDELIREGEKRGGIRRILITHGHPDHMGGALILRQHLKKVHIYACDHKGVPFADSVLPDGMCIPAGNDTLCSLYTPGHRFDHLCFLLQGQKTLFAGDLVSGSGSVVIIPPEGDMSDYMHSLKRVQQLDLNEIVPGHGPVIDDPHIKLIEYLEHRLQRECMILNAVQSEPRGLNLSAIVAQVYQDVDPSLHAMAHHSVEAHLLKLEHEGAVRHINNDVWSPA